MNGGSLALLVATAFIVGGWLFVNAYAGGLATDCDTFGQMRIGEAVYECRRK
ncbi:MAG: hypothetical protein AB7L90_25835 [Hyphomicrobiaceae bacterium]